MRLIWDLTRGISISIPRLVHSIDLEDGYLSDLLYLHPSFPDKRATLAGRDDKPQGDWWLGADGAVGHQRCQVLSETHSKSQQEKDKTREEK